MDAGQILAFRLARMGLAGPRTGRLADAAACPASDFAHDAALLALAARADFTREEYDAAVDAGVLVVAHVIRGAIHAVAAGDFALYGRGLLGRDDAELGAQLGRQVQRLGPPPGEALDEVAAATTDALSAGTALDRTELHEALRGRVRAELMPWCRGCKSHHVAPMLWRYATVKAGIRLDAARRYRSGEPGRAPAAGEVVRRFLGFYGPATRPDFADWAGLAPGHAQRLWDTVAADLEPVGKAWILRADRAALESPPTAEGVRLLPAGDPVLRKPNRALIAPDPATRKRLFRPVASPGVVLQNGRLAGLWRAKAKGRKLEIAVEKLGPVARAGVEEEAQRVAELRGAAEAVVVF